MAEDIFITFAAAFKLSSKNFIYDVAIQSAFSGIANYILGEVKEGENDYFQGVDTKKEIGDQYEYCDGILTESDFNEKSKENCLNFYAKLLLLKREAKLNDIELMKIATSLLNTMKCFVHG
jgi:hypothetical protein